MNRSEELNHLGGICSDVEQGLMAIRKRNLLVPICKMPEELLVHILRFLQTKKSDGGSLTIFHSPCQNHDFSWVRATWVCSHMRNVAIGAPELWPWVDSTRRNEWNALTTYRAGAVALNVSMSFDDEDEVWFDKGATETAPYLVKAGRACVDFTHRVVKDILVTKFPASLTVLETNNFHGSSAIAILPSLARQLVQFQVDATEVGSWPTLTWLKLRYFQLTRPSFKPNSLERIIAGMSQLEILYIGSVSQITENPSSSLANSGSNTSTTPQVGCDTTPPLHRLQRFHINDVQVTMVAMMSSLSCIRPLEQMSFDLSIPSGPRSAPKIDLLLRYMHNHLKSFTPSSTLRLRGGPITLTFLDLTWSPNGDNATGRTSTLSILYHTDHDPVFAEYGIIVKTIETDYSQRRSPVNLAERLTGFASKPFVKLERVIFRSVSLTPALRAWVASLEEREDGHKIELVYEACRDEEV
jgi:hypothetical protein